MEDSWCLILVIWGDTYSTSDVNRLVKNVLKFSAGCSEVLLISDKIRDGLLPSITQKKFPTFFARELFLKPGYIAKLSLFSQDVLPANKVCVYLDLDSAVVGDLGKIAALVKSKNDYFMLPSVFWELSLFTRLLTITTFGKFYKIGNSSILAFHSTAQPNLASTYEHLFNEKSFPDDERMYIDDVFISWFARYSMRPIPRSLGVMFRKEFLVRSKLSLWIRANIWFVKNRRRNIVAITLNGQDQKPERLLILPEGSIFSDKKGRFGRWDDFTMGGAKTKLTNYFSDEN